MLHVFATWGNHLHLYSLSSSPAHVRGDGDGGRGDAAEPAAAAQDAAGGADAIAAAENGRCAAEKAAELESWEKLAQEYQDQSKDTVADSVMVATQLLWWALLWRFYGAALVTSTGRGRDRLGADWWLQRLAGGHAQRNHSEAAHRSHHRPGLRKPLLPESLPWSAWCPATHVCTAIALAAC